MLDKPSEGKGDLDYLSELLAIQQSGPKNIGFFGTRNMGMTHQQLIEIVRCAEGSMGLRGCWRPSHGWPSHACSYALVVTGNHIYTSGATGTNAAVIRGALRDPASKERLTVVLPQSRSKQPPESQELISQVQQVIEMPQNDALPLVEASRICNRDIIRRVQQIICFAYHDSHLLLETCAEAKEMRKITTLFYLD